MNSVKSLTQAYSQTPWRRQVKFIVLFLLFVVFVALVAGTYLSVVARANTIGREILLMQSDIDDIELVIADLNTQHAFMTSASEMAKRAEDMGFEPIEKDQAIYVVVPGYIPRELASLAPPPGTITTVAASMPSDFTESLVDWLRQRILSTNRLLEDSHE